MGLSKFASAKNAYDYAFGVNSQVPALKVFSGGQATSGTYSITLDYGYIVSSDGTVVNLTANMNINLGTGTTNETVLPTTVSNPTPQILGTCVVTAVFSNGHGVGEEVNSGDGGLQVAAQAQLNAGSGLVIIDRAWANAVAATLTNAGITTALAAYKSLSANITVLNWLGINGALSYGAAAASAYASTTHVIY